MRDQGPTATSAPPTCFPGFLSAGECRDLVAEIDAAHQERAKIWTGEAFGVDPGSRLGSIAALTPDGERLVHERLYGVIAQLEQRFACEVSHLTAITALVYGPGDHFAAHSDGGYDDEAPSEVRRRRVSLVVALNDGARDFSGGELHFYPGCAPPDAASAGPEHIIRVRSEPGLLVAFASPMTHQVMPVIAGRRYSLALWALAPE
ncbi:MAG: SM-20-related protein [Solirubrobacteraceae bacterium]|jgi:predicted 2-oxoglutarate/Fe(II)-dependent dioxygenase YbiX|nr:SM-20-related protein [Solirubrobacteraceae bacterium]